MPTVNTRRRPPQAKLLRAGPWKGVRTTTDPLDDPPDLLVDATNLYIPDPQGSSGAYARPGFTLLNNGSPLVTSVTPFRGQGASSHVDLSGANYIFFVFQGKLFRADASLGVFTDVSPVGITIDSGVTSRVYATSLENELIITDGVNRPWIASNLSSTPITGTYIDFDGMGTAWSAFGPFVVYGGSVFCILSSVGGTGARTDIAWSFPGGSAAIGWQQTNYDFRWTLAQTATDPLFALAGTNTQLYYWRTSAIGSVSGTVGPNLSSSATHDSVSVNVGTQSPQSLVQFGTTIYFADQVGRPYRLVPGNEPEPIWLQMRGIIDQATVGYPGINRTVLTAAFEPVLNLYIIAIFTTVTSQAGPPVEAYAFDAKSGVYVGRWKVSVGTQIDTLAHLTDASGRGFLVVLGSVAAPTSTALAASGYIWSMNSLSSVGEYLTTEDPVLDYLTTEDAIQLTSEGTGSSNWQDNASAPTLSATTTRLGYAIDKVLTVDRVSALVGNTAPVTVSAITSALATTVEGVPTPSTVQDGISRINCGFSGVQGRGVEITVSPTTAASQWSVQQVSVLAVENLSAPDEV